MYFLSCFLFPNSGDSLALVLATAWELLLFCVLYASCSCNYFFFLFFFWELSQGREMRIKPWSLEWKMKRVPLPQFSHCLMFDDGYHDWMWWARGDLNFTHNDERDDDTYSGLVGYILKSENPHSIISPIRDLKNKVVTVLSKEIWCCLREVYASK